MTSWAHLYKEGLKSTIVSGKCSVGLFQSPSQPRGAPYYPSGEDTNSALIFTHRGKEFYNKNKNAFIYDATVCIFNHNIRINFYSIFSEIIYQPEKDLIFCFIQGRLENSCAPPGPGQIFSGVPMKSLSQVIHPTRPQLDCMWSYCKGPSISKMLRPI